MYHRKRQIYFIAITGILLLLAFTVSAQDDAPLTVKLGPPVEYESGDGKRFIARYGSLSDDSLHFIKVTMPDARVYTLPQVVSGSGVRYTDEMEILWWTHQGKVRVDVRDASGKWVTKYQELKEVQQKN